MIEGRHSFTAIYAYSVFLSTVTCNYRSVENCTAQTSERIADMDCIGGEKITVKKHFFTAVDPGMQKIAPEYAVENA